MIITINGVAQDVVPIVLPMDSSHVHAGTRFTIRHDSIRLDQPNRIRIDYTRRPDLVPDAPVASALIQGVRTALGVLPITNEVQLHATLGYIPHEDEEWYVWYYGDMTIAREIFAGLEYRFETHILNQNVWVQERYGDFTFGFEDTPLGNMPLCPLPQAFSAAREAFLVYIREMGAHADAMLGPPPPPVPEVAPRSRFLTLFDE